MIHIAQLLCPARHCLMAYLYDLAIPRQLPIAEEGARKFADLVEDKALNPWRGICGSRDLKWEDRPTLFPNMEEAERVGREMEREQLRIAALFAAGRN